MANRIGQQLGNYRLTHLLGQGGFAEVYLGEHTLLGTTVAIKVLHTRVAPEDMAQFQQEAYILASLKHPHIVRVLDFGIEERTPYLTMDYAPYGTLRARHPKGTVLPVPTVIEYVKQVAEALQYAHENKIVHRDVKPENMLIGAQNELLLSDFGIALVAQSSRHQDIANMGGTIAYMAPEQITGHPRTASDQYALGIVAYEWLCGMCPFRGSFTEIAAQHSIAPPTSPLEHLPTLLPEIEPVILTALEKRPEDRFPSVRAFADAFEQASQGIFPTQRAARSVPLSSPLKTTMPRAITGTVAVPPLPRPAELSAQLTKPTNPFVSVPVSTAKASPDLPTPEQAIGKAKMSRRAVLIGVGIATTAMVGAGVFVVLHPLLQAAGSQPFVYRGHSDAVWGVTWSPDGQRVASGSNDKTVQVWNASDGSNVITYRGHSNWVYAVAWSPDGQRIASGSADNTVQVWNASDGNHVFTFTGHSDRVLLVGWSPDGKRIASGSADKAAQVWNASDGSNVFTFTGHSDIVNTVAWSPDGKRVASGSADKTVQVWNASDGSNVFTFTGHSDTVYAVAWSPDGKRIASGSADKTVQVWNASDGSNVFTFTGHSDTVYAVAWSPDGKLVASGSSDNTVQVWNANDGSHVFSYKRHSNAVESVAWSPDGKQIASGSFDYTVQVWHEV
jgi:serine/threonine protein kinase